MSSKSQVGMVEEPLSPAGTLWHLAESVSLTLDTATCLRKSVTFTHARCCGLIYLKGSRVNRDQGWATGERTAPGLRPGAGGAGRWQGGLAGWRELHHSWKREPGEEAGLGSMERVGVEGPVAGQVQVPRAHRQRRPETRGDLPAQTDSAEDDLQVVVEVGRHGRHFERLLYGTNDHTWVALSADVPPLSLGASSPK